MHHLGETMIVNYFLRKIAKWFCVQEYLVVAWRWEQVLSWYFRQDFWDHHHPFIDLACAWKRSWSVKVFVLSWFHESLEEGNSLLPKKLSYFLKKPCLLVFRDSDLEKPFTCWNNKVFVQIPIFEGRQISRTFCKNFKDKNQNRFKTSQ